DRHVAGMKVGAVTDIGKNVFLFSERRLADPGGALAAHLAVGVGAAVHPDGERVATDAAKRAAAVDDFCRGVVRAAGAEIWATDGGDLDAVERAGLLAQEFDARLQLLS